MAEIWLIVLGLGFDIIGVVILTVYSDKTFIWILRWLGKTVDEDWNDIIDKAKKRVRKITAVGVIFLVGGFALQIIGNLL